MSDEPLKIGMRFEKVEMDEHRNNELFENSLMVFSGMKPHEDHRQFRKNNDGFVPLEPRRFSKVSVYFNHYRVSMFHF